MKRSKTIRLSEFRQLQKPAAASGLSKLPGKNVDSTETDRLLDDLLDLVDLLDAWQKELPPNLLDDEPNHKWPRRVETIRSAIIRLLVRSGVSPLDLVGQAPSGTVTVVARNVREDVEREMISEVVMRGWLRKGEVLRKAGVIVSTPKKQER